ncbi:hypothetical protein SDC9_130369 [bioreactor metagenome]|uniref:Uncharacterized protein n=1 Tax=bioreactor metagenome TaxID=1076179 RepID=A0A645D2A2_9ZZZZ
MAQGGAGVGVAAVGDDAAGSAVLQMLHGHIDGSGLHPVGGVGGGGGALGLGHDKGEVLLARQVVGHRHLPQKGLVAVADAVLDAAAYARRFKTLRGGDSARDLFHNQHSSFRGVKKYP